jgi:hypothetical protein
VANRSGLIALSDGVRAYFEANDVAASVPPLGWNQRTRWTNQGPGGGSRVIFMPGEFDGGLDARPLKGGPFRKARHTHDVRELAWWDKLATMSVWGANPEALTDEQAQIDATEELLERAFEAVHNAVDPVSGIPVGLADIIWHDSSWTLPPSERAFGREILVTFTHAGPLYARPTPAVFPLAVVSRNPST